jgi:hypothetical protein
LLSLLLEESRQPFPLSSLLRAAALFQLIIEETKLIINFISAVVPVCQ